MVKNNKGSNTAVGPFLQEHLGQEVAKLSEIASEITYQIPKELSHKFKVFFDKFDDSLDKLDIQSYGISVTTLEEVFLNIGSRTYKEEDDEISEEPEAQDNEHNMIKADEEATGEREEDDIDKFSLGNFKPSGNCVTICSQMYAILRRRIQAYKKNPNALFFEIMVPVFLVCIGLAFSKIDFFNSSPERNLVPASYALKQKIMYNKDLLISSDNDI